MEPRSPLRHGLGAGIFLAGLAGLVLALAGSLFVGDLGLDWDIGRMLLPLGVTGLALMLVGRLIRGPDAGLHHLVEDGMDGRATVAQLTPAGRRGRNQVIDLELTVDVPGRPPYAMSKRAVMPDDLAARLALGSSLPVKVDPVDQTRVAIHLAAMRHEEAEAGPR